MTDSLDSALAIARRLPPAGPIVSHDARAGESAVRTVKSEEKISLLTMWLDMIIYYKRADVSFP